LVNAPAREPVFSPDGKMIAYVEDKNLGRAGGGLWIVPSQGGTPKRVANAKMASSPIWSPDGEMIAFVDDKDKAAQIHIVPMRENDEGAKKIVTIDAPEGIKNVLLLAGWIPDNKIGAIFVKPTEFGLYTLPAEGGKATVVAYGGYPTKPRWSPDGKQIFHTNIADKGKGAWNKLAVSVVPAEGGKVSTVPIQSDVKIDVPAVGGGNKISPDGRMIVFPENYGKHIWTLPVEGGKPNQLVEAPESFADLFPCWSPDGKAVAFVRFRVSKNYVEGFSETNIFIVNSMGGEPKPLTSESHKVFTTSIGWSPDGRLLAYFSRDENSTDGTLNVIPLDGEAPRVVGKVKGIFINKELAWSPDSKLIAFNSSDDKIIKVMSLEDGNIVEIKTDLVDTRIYHLDWSSDGKKLVFAGYKGGGREFWLMEDFLHLVKKRK
jgi:Tol biopolymer transport system component